MVLPPFSSLLAPEHVTGKLALVQPFPAVGQESWVPGVKGPLKGLGSLR